jgi:hypothetical protein
MKSCIRFWRRSIAILIILVIERVLFFALPFSTDSHGRGIFRTNPVVTTKLYPLITKNHIHLPRVHVTINLRTQRLPRNYSHNLEPTTTNYRHDRQYKNSTRKPKKHGS